MKLVITFILSVIFSFSVNAKSVGLEELLKLKLGAEFINKKKNDETHELSYEIETKKNKIFSILIYLNKPLDLEQQISSQDTGFCLTQKSEGDFVANRYFFFNENTNIRYEVNSKLKIKSILVKDIPGAKDHRKCKLKNIVKKNDNKIIRYK